MKRKTIPIMNRVSKDTLSLVSDLAFIQKVKRLLRPKFPGNESSYSDHPFHLIERTEGLLIDDLLAMTVDTIPHIISKSGYRTVVLRKDTHLLSQNYRDGEDSSY